jgi:hypothetical protein
MLEIRTRKDSNLINTNYNHDSVSHRLSVHQAGSTALDGASYSYDFGWPSQL